MTQEETIEQVSMIPTDRLAKAYVEIQSEYAKLIGSVMNLKLQIAGGQGPLKTCQEIQKIHDQSRKAVVDIVDEMTKQVSL